MSKVYDRCPQEVADRVERLVSLFHSELKNAGVTFDLMFVGRESDDDGVRPVLSCHGVPALAVASIVPSKQRAKGCRDVEILIDRDRYNDCTEAQQDALLDHEINHFELVRDKNGAVKFDAELRPKIKIRPHDYDFGWFEVVARRHGGASFEVQQAKALWDESHQSLFPFVNDATVQAVPLPIPTLAQPIPQAQAESSAPETADTAALESTDSTAPAAETSAEPTAEAAAGATGAPAAEPESPGLRQQRWAFFFGRPAVRKLAPDAIKKPGESPDETETVGDGKGQPAVAEAA